MAITTSGGVGYDQGASVRNMGNQILNTVGQMDQRKQFQQKQALDVGVQQFMQALSMAEISGDPEDFFARGEGRQLLDGVTKSFSAATGKQLTSQQASQLGLGMAAEYYAKNPSLKSKFDQQARAYFGLSPDQATVVPPKATTDPGAVPAPRAGDETGATQASAGGATGAGFAGGVDPGAAAPADPVPNVISQGYSAAPEAPVSTAYTDMYGAPPVAIAAPPQTTAVQNAQELARQQAIRPSQPVGSKPPVEALKVTGMPGDPTALQVWSLQAVPRKAEEPTQEYQLRRQKWENDFIKLNSMRSAFDPLDPNRNYAIPGGAVQATQPEPAAPSRQLGSQRSSALPGSLQFGDDMRGLSQWISDMRSSNQPGDSALPPATMSRVSDGAVMGITPKSEQMLQSLASPGTSGQISATPKIDSKMKARYRAVLEASVTKVKSIVDGAIQSAAARAPGTDMAPLTQRDKTAVKELQVRSKAYSEKLAALAPDEMRSLYRDSVKWLNNATPEELQAAGMGEVADKRLTRYLAELSAQSAVLAAQARGGADQATAQWGMQKEAFTLAQNLYNTVADIAAKEFKGDVAAAFGKYNDQRQTYEMLLSTALNQPITFEVMRKDPNFIQNAWAAMTKQPFQGAATGLTLMSGGSGSSGQSTTGASTADKAAIEDKYSY